MTHWLLLLQEFDITIKDRPGKENPVEDLMSRVPKINDLLAVDNQFLDEHLLVVVVKIPWYSYVESYLAVGKFPIHLMERERKQIV